MRVMPFPIPDFINRLSDGSTSENGTSARPIYPQGGGWVSISHFIQNFGPPFLGCVKAIVLQVNTHVLPVLVIFQNLQYVLTCAPLQTVFLITKY